MSGFPPPELPEYTNASENAFVPKRDGKAVAALVCGIIGLIGFGLVLGAVAIGLGFQSRRNIQRSRGALTGEGLAMAGLVLGVIDVAAFFFFVTRR